MKLTASNNFFWDNLSEQFYKEEQTFATVEMAGKSEGVQ